MPISSEQLPGAWQLAAMHSSIAPPHLEDRFDFVQLPTIVGHLSAFALAKPIVWRSKLARHALHAADIVPEPDAGLRAWEYAGAASNMPSIAKRNFRELVFFIFPHAESESGVRMLAPVPDWAACLEKPGETPRFPEIFSPYHNTLNPRPCK